MKRFTLLINGQDLDTGIYEYCPYADKKISDFRTTFRILTQLKIGKLSEDSEEVNKYIFAKYCIVKEKFNSLAIEAAYKASKIFRQFPLAKRRKIMDDIRDLIIANKNELIELLIFEGHTRRLAEWQLESMEKAIAKETVDFYEAELEKEIKVNNKETVYLIRKPDGVVCLSPPQNAPASNSFLAVFSLLAGNSLIVKPPFRNPISTIFAWKKIVFEALKKNVAPNGVLNIIVGNSKKITEEWLDSPFVNSIIFFGESNKGLDIGLRAFGKGKKTILELAGNDMLLIWKDAPVDKAVAALLDCFLGSTQICMVPKKAIIHEDIYSEIENKVLKEAKELKTGLPSDPQTDLIPVYKIKDYFDFLDDALKKGAKLLYGGKRLNYKGEEDQNGSFIQPTIIKIEDIEKAKKMICVKEENFFPILPLIKVTSNINISQNERDKIIFDKMINLVNNNEYGLRVSLWCKSENYIKKFMYEIQIGGIIRINSAHIDFSLFLSTHGGIGKTGGPYGEMNYCWQKTSHLQGISKTLL